MTHATAHRIAMEAVRDLQLVIHRPSGTDITSSIKAENARLFISLNVSEVLDMIDPRDVGASIERALLSAFAASASLHSGLHHARQMVEVGVCPDMDTIAAARIRPEDLEVV